MHGAIEDGKAAGCGWGGRCARDILDRHCSAFTPDFSQGKLAGLVELYVSHQSRSSIRFSAYVLGLMRD